MKKTFKELLTAEEWQQKRTEILERDNHTCQRCGLNPNVTLHNIALDKVKFHAPLPKTLTNYYTPAHNNMKVVFTNVEGMNCDIYAKTYKDIELNKEYKILIHVALKDKFTVYFFGSTMPAQINNPLFLANREFSKALSPMLNAALLKYEKNVLYDNFEVVVDTENIYFVEDAADMKAYLKQSKLHVHLKCHRKGIEIWEHSNEEYTTLCNICHNTVHQNQFIPYYNEKGDDFELLTPCHKCEGSGYLATHKHIDNGICVECDGRGY